MIFAALLLWLVPVAVAAVSLRHFPSHTWRNVGIAFGAVISPASVALYVLFYFGPIAAIFGFIGLLLSMLHGAPGYELTVALGLVPSHTVLRGWEQLPIDVANAIIWSVVYGSLGWLLDRSRRKGNPPAGQNAA